jgi:hypothetical protein
VSNFNYRLSATLNSDLAYFTNNYVDFINKVAKAAGVSSRNIRVLSIKEGSVTVNMEVNSNDITGSCDSVSTENKLITLLGRQNNVANMQVTASSVAYNCDTGTTASSGKLTTIAIILISICTFLFT